MTYEHRNLRTRLRRGSTTACFRSCACEPPQAAGGAYIKDSVCATRGLGEEGIWN
jgi:hypothetical protein